MRRLVVRLIVATLLVVPAGALPLPAAPASVAVAQAWASLYDGDASGDDIAYAGGAAPDDSRVFVTGTSHRRDTFFDFATTAVDASTGALLWTAVVDGGAGLADTARALAVTPDSATVVVAGDAKDAVGSYGLVVAHDTSDGSNRWTAALRATGGGAVTPLAVAVAPGGARVYVAGNTAADGLVVALDAATGSEAWRRTYDAGGTERVYAMIAGAAGTRLYLALQTTAASRDLTVLALDALSGTVAWTARYDGPAAGEDAAVAVAESPDGTRVFATGPTWTGFQYDVVTLALSAADGSRLWASRAAGPGVGNSLAVSPDGTRVYSGGHASVGTPGTGFLVTAYDAATGTALWENRWQKLPGPEGANAMALSPDGSRLVLAGVVWSTFLWDFATVAYDTATGERAWTATWGAADENAVARAVAITHGGTRVHAIGFAEEDPRTNDYVAVAYDLATGSLLRTARYDGVQSSEDHGGRLVYSPDGSRMYATATSVGHGTLDDALTIAHDAQTGARLWVHRLDGAEHGKDEARAVAVTADGAGVVVAARTSPPTRNAAGDVALARLDAATGAEVWRLVVDAGGDEEPADLVLDDAAGAAYVVTNPRGGGRVIVLAVDLATGTERWRADAAPAGAPRASGAGVATAGGRVIAAGWAGPRGSEDGFVVAFDGATGSEAWRATLDASCSGTDRLHALAVSPDGLTVAVAGATTPTGGRTVPCALGADPAALQRALLCGTLPDDDFGSWPCLFAPEPPAATRVLVAALDAGTGAVRWTSVATGGQTGEERATSVAVASGAVVVSGLTLAPGSSELYNVTTLAFDAATGVESWRAVEPATTSLFVVSTNAVPRVVAEGGRVFVASSASDAAGNYDLVSFGYDPATGSRLWSTRFDGAAAQGDWLGGLAASAGGDAFALSAASRTGVYWKEGEDALVVAYSAQSL